MAAPAAAIYSSRNGRGAFNCTSCRHSIISYSSSSLTNTNAASAAADDDDKNAGKLKTPTPKTAKSRTMARLINNKPWTDELTSSLSTLSPSLSKTTFFQTLRLIKTPLKAFNFFKYAQDIGFTHNDQSYLSILEILGQNRNLNAARNFLFSIEKNSGGIVKLDDRFFNSLIRSYGRAGLFNESIKMFLKMKSIGLNPSVVTFNNLLSILLKRGRTNLAKKVFDEMLTTYGVTPDTYTFNILIRGFAMNSMVSESFHFFKEMSRLGCVADLITYNTLVDGLCRAGKVRIAHYLLKRMIKKKESLGLSPDVVTYTTLIRGYCMKQEIDEALVVFEEMVREGLKPNKITYNTVIQGLCEAKKLDKIKEILDGVSLGGGGEFVPDACTFNILMNAHCNGGKLNEATKVFAKMLDMGVQPDSASYSVLIRSFCQKGDFEKAEELFNELSAKEILLRENGCTPLVAAYKHMFEYLCENGKTKKAERVLRQLLKRGIQDPPSYKTLIMGHCRESSYEAGYDLLVLMLGRDFTPDVETYESLVGGLLQKGDPVLAHKTLEKMIKSSSLHPKTPTIHSVLAELLKKGCARESASFVILMLDQRIRLNISLSTDTVKLLFSKGLQDKAFEIVALLYKNGFSIEMEEVVGFLCHRGKILEARKMLLFSLESDQNLNTDLCNQVISGLCKRDKISEAFSLYFELVEKGTQEQFSCLDDLRTALKAKGRLSEAEFVFKRMPKQGDCDTSAAKFITRLLRP